MTINANVSGTGIMNLSVGFIVRLLSSDVIIDIERLIMNAVSSNGNKTVLMLGITRPAMVYGALLIIEFNIFIINLLT
jgi:hypothetical protein